MSPAAVEPRPPPITSHVFKPSLFTHHNPKPSSEDPQPPPPPPSFPNFNFTASDAPPRPDAPPRSARPRPRLVKQRRQQSTRPRTETGPEVNPFSSVSGAPASNESGFSNGAGVGFVFGAKPSGADVDKLDEGKVNCAEKLGDLGFRECSGNEGSKCSSGIGYVFGSSSNLSSGKKDSSGNMDKLFTQVEPELEKVKHESFTFRAAEEFRSWNKDHDKGNFVFGSGANKGSDLADLKPVDCQDDVNSNKGDCRLNDNSQNDNLSSDFNSKCKLVSGSGNDIASEKTHGENHESANNDEYGSASDTPVGTSGSEPFIFQAGEDQCPQTSVNEADSVAGPTRRLFRRFTRKYNRTTDGSGVCSEDSNTPLQFPSCLKESLFPEIKKSDFSAKGRSHRNKRSKKTRGKSKKSSLYKQRLGGDHVPKDTSSQEPSVSSGCYSPMDFSVYGEATFSNQHSREASVTSDDFFHLVNDTAPCASDATIPIGHNGADSAATEEELTNQGDQVYRESISNNSGYHGDRVFAYDCSSKGPGPGAEIPCFSSKNEQVNGLNFAGRDSENCRVDTGVTVEIQERGCGTPCSASGFGDMEGKNFTFNASPSAQGCPTVANRRIRRVKHKSGKTKAGCNTFVISPTPKVEFGGSDQFTPHSSTPFFFDVGGKPECHDQVEEVHIPSTNATYETCEKWRTRGNKAYKNNDFSKAEDFYTQGIISVPSNERSGSCLKPLLLCYSNRAAARMPMGRIREALGDCMMAIALDPNFLKVQMRAANYHLLLGEVENAQQYFNKCIESATGVCLDRRVVLDSADGIQKAQKVADYTDRSAKLLEQRTKDAALSAIELVSEALSISEYSEKLLEMKAEALCLLGRYEEAIQLCEQTLSFAERNFSSLNSVVSNESPGYGDYPYARLWRWFFISKSNFHLGRLEAALGLLEKLEQVGSIKDRYANKNLKPSISLAAVIRELLSHKDAGNEAFRSGRHAEAVEHYTFALSSNIGSRPFAAICLGNRAAAHQALGQITDAIADCSLAIALDGNYVKAVSRRATLHEMIRDYGQATTDLQRLISVLEHQSGDKTKEFTSQGSSNSHAQELRNVYRRMPSIEEEAKKGNPLNFYLILGIKPSDTSSEIKKAYRKAALKHHPDKAGQFLARAQTGDEGRLWKELSLEVHKDADRLFKMIGEAYAVLSDPDKRSEYDLEEDMRKAANECKERSTYSDFPSNRRSRYRKSDFHSSPYERRSNWDQESWRTYGRDYSQWF